MWLWLEVWVLCVVYGRETAHEGAWAASYWPGRGCGVCHLCWVRCVAT